MFKRLIKIEPTDEDINSIVININEDFNYKNIVNSINKLSIDEKYKEKIIDNLKNHVYFIDNQLNKKTSIDYICWKNEENNILIKINNIYKALNKHYYEFKLK